MVNTRDIALKYRLMHRAQVMQERVQSGLSIKAYCKQMGICGSTYFYRQRRVRGVAAAEVGLSVCEEAQPPQVSFSAVRVVGAAVYPTAMETGAPGQIHIDVGDIRLRVESGYPVEQETLFVFCNRNRDRLKILQWDGDGFRLHFKRLEKGHFRWPQPGSEPTMTLSIEELRILLDGAKVELKLRRNEVLERRII